MPSDNPFSEPQDSDRTMFIPRPGGVRTPTQPPLSEPTRIELPPPTPAHADGPGRIETGSNPLLAASATLLALLARLRNTARPPDSGDLRARAVSELRRFDQRAREDGVPIEQLRPAHYALCASLDDVVLATPWGAEGAWAARSLVSTFHEQVRSGEGFFSVLRQVSQSPSANLPVLELMYFCLSLGFQGQYRLSPRGPAELDRVREELYTLIARHRAPVEMGLAPHWRGVDAPYRARRAELPLWVAAAAGLAVAVGLFGFVFIQSNIGSDAVLSQINAAPPRTLPMLARPVDTAPSPPLPAPPPPPACDRLQQALASLTTSGEVSIDCTQQDPVIRLSGDGMFASGSATLQPKFLAPLAQIGTALRSETGTITVAGYTDNQPIRRTLRYPSNLALSKARADSALAQIGTGLGDTARLRSDGRGEADPIESNPALQSRNRRIEIILEQKD